MNPAKLLSFLTNPALINSTDIAELEQITREFPYFNLPYILLTKAYEKQKSYKYNTLLPVASIHSKNREYLYNYIHTEISEKEKEEELTKVEEETKNQEDTQTTEQKIIRKIEKPLEEVINNDELTPDIEEKIPAIKPKKEHYSLEDSVKEVKPTPLDMAGEFTFSEWLEMKKSPSNSVEEVEKVSNVNESISLIDKFLQDKPRISRPRKEFYKAADFAKRSDTLGDELLTETFAKILAKQGELDKAIKVYDKLIVKFPQKRIYFAALKQKLIEKNV